MERIKNAYDSTHAAVRRTIEWRSPLTGLYLMIVNSAFWLGVMYGDEKFHQTALATSAAGIFAWDVLLSPSHEHNIITHILLWPFQSIWRTAAVVNTIFGVVSLRGDQIEKACWVSYAALASLLINPVWEYHQVNKKISNGCQTAANKVVEIFQMVIVTPLKKVYSAVKYVVLLQFIPPMWAYFKHFIFNFRTCCGEIYTGIVDFFKNCYRSTVDFFKRCGNSIYRFLHYWFCAEWWPVFKEWVKIHIGSPLRRFFNYVCFCVVYVVCGHWVPPLYRWLRARAAQLGAILYKYVVEPSKRYVARQFERFRVWLRAKLHRLAVAIRDSILWPICLLVVEVAEALCGAVYRILLEPILVYLYQRYKIIETAVLINLLGPALNVVINNIPEKNPLCDDSDVEFEGYLPEDVQDDPSEDESEDDEDAAFRPPSRMSDEEMEFTKGLRFRDVDASESSDEEFDLPKSSWLNCTYLNRWWDENYKNIDLQRQKKRRQYTSNDNLERDARGEDMMSTSSSF